MRSFIFSIFLLGGLSFALAVLPVRGQVSEQRSKVGEIEINKQPLKEFVKTVKQFYETTRVNWAESFSIEVEGVLTKEGKLAQAKVTKTEGSKELVEIAEQAITAFGDSGWLGYLSNAGVEKVKITAAQNSESFSLTFVSKLQTQERANVVASGLNGIVQAALLMDKNGMKKLGDDERRLLTNTKVTASEKTANINFTMPAIEFREMLRNKVI